METMTRKLFRVREVAQILGLSKSQVYAMATEGELASVRVGRALRIPARVVDEFIARAERQAGIGVENAA